MTRLRVRVTPRAERDEIMGWQGDVLRVRVRAVPEKGRANEAVCALIATALGVPPSSVTVERGTASRVKVVRVETLTEEELRAGFAGS